MFHRKKRSIFVQFDLGGEVRRDGLARKTELTAEFQVIHVIQS